MMRGELFVKDDTALDESRPEIVREAKACTTRARKWHARVIRESNPIHLSSLRPDGMELEDGDWIELDTGIKYSPVFYPIEFVGGQSNAIKFVGKPGDKIALHHHEQRQMTIIVEGTVLETFSGKILDAERRPVEIFPAWTVHELEVVGTEPCRGLVVYRPPMPT